jgi:hypothetical protein
MSPRALSLLLLAVAACGTTGAESFVYPVHARGPGPDGFAVGEWQVTLTRAEVAVGPVYLCATAAASPDLCHVAIGEFADAAIVDALAGEAGPLGEIAARPGDVRSAMLDYGVSWFTTDTGPEALSELGHSARLVGTAVRGDTTITFDATIDVVPPMRGSPALVGVYASADEPGPDSELELELDPRGWLAGVDLDALAAAGANHTIVPGDAAHAAIAFAMTTQPPTFRWSEP